MLQGWCSCCRSAEQEQQHGSAAYVLVFHKDAILNDTYAGRQDLARPSQIIQRLRARGLHLERLPGEVGGDASRTGFIVTAPHSILVQEAQAVRWEKETRYHGIAAPMTRLNALHFASAAPEFFSPSERLTLLASLLDRVQVSRRLQATSARGALGSSLKGLLSSSAAVHRARAAVRLASNGVDQGALVDLYPLHDLPSRAALQQRWVASPCSRPIEHMREYFGAHVAMYFAWLGFYRSALLPLAGMGLAVAFLQGSGRDALSLVPGPHSPRLVAAAGVAGGASVLFVVLVVVWLGVVQKLWRRRHTALAFAWGSQAKDAEADSSRAQYAPLSLPCLRTVEETDPFGHVTVHEHPVLRSARVLCVTLPVMAGLLLAATACMVVFEYLQQYTEEEITQFWVQDSASGVWKRRGEPAPADGATAGGGEDDFVGELPPWAVTLLSLAPTIGYTALLPALTSLSFIVARWTSEFENHHSCTAYTTSLLLKRILLVFFNYTVGLLYAAFVRQDLAVLRQRLFVALVVKAVALSFVEMGMTLLPYAKACLATRGAGHGRAVDRVAEAVGLAEPGASTSPRLQHTASCSATAAARQAALTPYDPFEDTLEMFVQYVHVVLFAVVYPTGALFAVLNNAVEMVADASKVLLSRRPRPAPPTSQHAWNLAFAAVGFLAVLTNLGAVAVAYAEAGPALHLAKLAADAGEAGTVPHGWDLMSACGQGLVFLAQACVSPALPLLTGAVTWALRGLHLIVGLLFGRGGALLALLSACLAQDTLRGMGVAATHWALGNVAPQPGAAGGSGVFVADMQLPWWAWLAVCIALEHLCLCVLLGIGAVSDEPPEVTAAITARRAYLENMRSAGERRAAEEDVPASAEPDSPASSGTKHSTPTQWPAPDTNPAEEGPLGQLVRRLRALPEHRVPGVIQELNSRFQSEGGVLLRG